MDNIVPCGEVAFRPFILGGGRKLVLPCVPFGVEGLCGASGGGDVPEEDEWNDGVLRMNGSLDSCFWAGVISSPAGGGGGGSTKLGTLRRCRKGSLKKRVRCAGRGGGVDGTEGGTAVGGGRSFMISCASSSPSSTGDSASSVGGTTSSSKNAIACSFDTPPLPATSTPSGSSILFPTTMQQNSFSSPASTGHLSQNSDHHFLSACSEVGELMSKRRRTASAPRKKAEERDEKRS
jgi:hypothetical protein